ncbi:MAG: aminotransferase class I/II-fold pyridoxal phosphate-dependent enzyme [Aurantibacter sp.]
MVHKVDGFPGREIILNGEKFLYFGGTAYLGLQSDTEFQDIFVKNIKKFGTNYGASRKANLRLSIYEEAETYLARLVGSQGCLTLSSGYLAGQLISTYFQKKGHPRFFASGTHEAVHLLGSKNYEDHERLVLDLKKVVEVDGKSPVLFLDSIDVDGKNFPNFDWLKKLPVDRLILVVDDSHGLGIVGDEGGGVFKSLKKIKSKELVVCGSLGKGFGIQAGIVAGNNQLMTELKATGIFATASPATPASLATMMQSSKILSEKRKLLLKNIDYFLAQLGDTDFFDFMPGYPSFAFDDVELSSHLLRDYIIVTDFNYPTESDPIVQRIVLSAQHTLEDIGRLADSINAYFG